MLPPRTSVVIPCYKVDRYLPEALESIAAQTQPVLEIIVIDDGSPNPLQKPANWHGPKLKWIRKQNQGLGAARNTGIEQAEGEFIAFLDADDHWSPRKIELQEKALDENTEVAACYTQCIKHEGYFPFGPYPDHELTSPELTARLWASQFFPPSSILVRTEKVRLAGGFREGLSNGEDLDFWFRILRHGNIIGVQQPLTWYRQHDSQITTDDVRRVMGSKESRRGIIDQHQDMLVAAGIPKNQSWLAYRQEILSVYFRRKQRAARTMLWDYVKDHPSDLAMWKYLIATFFPASLMKRIRGSIG